MATFMRILRGISSSRTHCIPCINPVPRERSLRHSTLGSIHDVVTDAVMDRAYEWLCERRKAYPDAADVWSFRHHWTEERERIRAALIASTYRFGLLHRVTLATGEIMELWSARDALVLKCLALTLVQRLPRSSRCFHLKADGVQKHGAKAALREVMQYLGDARFVLKTDVKSYYASIDHFRLMDALADHVQDTRITTLVYQYLTRCAESGGEFFDHARGISLGCPLSPVIGAFFLYRLDVALERLGLFYVRYMDDILVLAPTRRKLRQAVRVVNQMFAALGLEKAPNKTYIGRIEKGFDFLGYHVTPDELTVSSQTWAKFLEQRHRRYAQAPRHLAVSRGGAYERRWWGWSAAGLKACMAWRSGEGYGGQGSARAYPFVSDLDSCVPV